MTSTNTKTTPIASVGRLVGRILIDCPRVGVNCAVNKSLSDFPVPLAGLNTLQHERVWPRCC